jgi:hypothetical protein
LFEDQDENGPKSSLKRKGRKQRWANFILVHGSKCAAVVFLPKLY